MSCIDYAYDYVDGLQYSTLAPILVALFMFFLYCIRYVHIVCGRYTEESYDRKAEILKRIFSAGGKYFTALLLLTFLVLPGVTTTILGSYQCLNVDPDGVTGAPQLFL